MNKDNNFIIMYYCEKYDLRPSVIEFFLEQLENTLKILSKNKPDITVEQIKEKAETQ